MTNLIVKATFQNATRRFSAPRPLTFTDLESTLRTRFATVTPFVVTYQDPENDTITISSDEELAELIAIANDTATPMRVRMFTHDDVDAGKTAPNANAVPPGNMIEVPHLEKLIEGVAELLEVIKDKIIVPHEQDARADVHRADLAADVVMRDAPAVQSAQDSKGGKGLLRGLRPYIAAFPEGKSAFKKCLWSVSPEVKVDFKKLVHHIVKSEHRATIVAALKDAFPLLRGWIGECIGDSGVPDSSEVERILGEIQKSLLESGVENEDVNKITDFLRLVLADDGAVNILRRTKGMEHMPWEQGFVNSVKLRRVRRGFDVHQRIACDACKMKPIIGTRYKSVDRKNYNLCANCYGNESVKKEGIEFKECKYVWESALDTAKVPPAPLRPKERGPKVMFLHKVLTDLGYMNESMYKQHPGFYGDNTMNAVIQFQREKMGDLACMLGIYDESTAESLRNAVDGHDVQVTPAVSGPSQPLAMQD